MRRSLYYLWTALSSYTVGIFVYTLILKFMGEALGSDDVSRLLFWTFPTFMCVMMGLYLLAVLILKRFNRYTFWLQTLLFFIISLIPASIVPIISGFGVFFGSSFLISVEGLLFVAMFASTSLLFSYGVWVGQEKRNRGKKIYLIVSIVILLILIALSMV